MVMPLRFDSTDTDLGMETRSARKGPEQLLVNEFITQLLSDLSKKPEATQWALFCEPAVTTGYPDIVVVEYDPAAFENWSDARQTLQKKDLRILDLLHFAGAMTSEEISLQLGFRRGNLLGAIERLLDAELLTRHQGTWQIVQEDKVFGVKQLRAIEAKISNWQHALAQAQVNLWFASESYVVMPMQSPRVDVLRRAEEMGIGVYLGENGAFQEVVCAPKTDLPICHASWFFNEWIGRKLHLVGSPEK